jgi:hypothetical protein
MRHSSGMVRRLPAAAVAAVLLLGSGCDSQQPSDGYTMLGKVEGAEVEGKLLRQGDAERLALRISNDDEVLCDGSGSASDTRFLICDSTVGSNRALAVAAPPNATEVVVELTSGPVSMQVLPAVPGWPVRVAAAVLVDAPGNVLGVQLLNADKQPIPAPSA